MSSPLVNEELVKTYLNPKQQHTTEALRHLSAACLVNAWDRNLTRDNFVMVMEEVLEMYTLLARVETAGATYKVLGAEDPEKPTKILDEATINLCKRLEILRTKLCDQMALMQECPRDEDKVS